MPPCAARLVALLDGWSDLGTADQRLSAFVASFPTDREHRWSRDLAAEVLHFTAPERYPLMTRWVWDARVNTGVLREIWHSDNNVDAGTIAVGDGFATFVTLREELEGFCRRTACSATCRSTSICSAPTSMPPTSTTGAANICTRISAAAPRPTRWRTRAACSGLDAVDTESGRTRLKLIDGEAYVLGEPRQLSS